MKLTYRCDLDYFYKKFEELVKGSDQRNVHLVEKEESLIFSIAGPDENFIHISPKNITNVQLTDLIGSSKRILGIVNFDFLDEQARRLKKIEDASTKPTQDDIREDTKKEQ